MDGGSFFIDVRPARVEDAAAIAKLSSQLGYPSTEEQVGERLAVLIHQPEGNGIFVAEVPESGVVGWVHVVTVRPVANEPRGELTGLVVDEEWRRTGVGRALVAGSEHWARNRGLRMLGLRANAERNDAQRFYEWLGFERTKTQHVYRRPIE
ncbi:MAG: GNAT family N-acetyltransferase [Verrucomicrobia bacterium]|nr:GNAT family N-acetyltransferase [Verrucomicrobiota bacterium]